MASGFKFSPRCDAAATCCITAPPECGWFDDDFERAASTALGDKWLEVVGDWEIDASGRLVIDTSTARARPRYDSDGLGTWTNFGNLSEFYLRAVVSATADGDEILLGNRMGSFIGGYSDSRVFGLRVGAAAKIWFGAADRSSLIYDCDVTAAANTEHEIIFDCGVIYLNGTAVANVIGLIDRTNVADFFVGTNDVTGEVRIQELVIEHTALTKSGCPTCPICPLFLGESPATITVTVAGHTGRWAFLNGNYTVSRIQDFGRLTDAPCIYQITGLGKTMDVFGDGTIIEDIETFTVVTGSFPNAYFTGSDLNMQYQYNDPTAPCSGDDAIMDYVSSGYTGINLDPGNTQAAATATIDL